MAQQEQNADAVEDKKKRKTHNYRCQMEESGALEALSATDEPVGGNASLKSD